MELKFLGTPTLETERLILRKLNIFDAQDVFDYAKEPQVASYVTWEPHKTIEESVQFIKWLIERTERDEAGDWGIELKENRKIIGSRGFRSCDFKNSCGILGYWIGKDYWGRGLMTEALKRIIKFSFEDLKINRIEAMHVPDNIASGKVMEKAGMAYEGYLRQKIFAKGIYRDVKIYSIVKGDLYITN